MPLATLYCIACRLIRVSISQTLTEDKSFSKRSKEEEEALSIVGPSLGRGNAKRLEVNLM